MTSEKVTVITETGLHARPATLVVSLAAKFKSDVKLQKNEKIINAKSIMGLLSLGVVKNDEIIILAEGEDEVEAVRALKSLIEKPSID